MLSENKTVRKNAEYPNNRIDRCGLSDLKSDTYSNSFSPSDVYSEKNSNISSDTVLVPGFVDVHVHLREPGFSYKETIKTGTLAAANGGYAAICTMPNLDPVPDSIEHLERQLEIIRRDACIPVYPYGAITIGENGRELSDMDALAPYVVAFSDDGKGVQNEEIMLAAMKKAKKLHKIIAAHCEDNSLVRGGCIHDGNYADRHSLPGICSESEWRPIARDIELVRKSGCPYHVCHVSTKESVNLIRKAKSEGLDITCETAPHYLVLCDEDLVDSGSFKMNPPIRSEADRAALIEGIIDGTIDMIATDHAPHSEKEKSGGLRSSLNGIVGLETAFPVLYTRLVRRGILSLNRLIELMSTAPARRFGIDIGNRTAEFEISTPYIVDSAEFLSLGKASPFVGMQVFGKCIKTTRNGKTVKEDKVN